MQKHFIKPVTTAVILSVLGWGLIGCQPQSQPRSHEVQSLTPVSPVTAPPQVPTLPQAPAYMLEDGKAHFSSRVAEIDKQTSLQGGVLFIGDSLTEGGNWAALFPGVESRNHGVGWDTTTGVKKRLPQILKHNPLQIYIMIGTNDIGYDRKPSEIVSTLSESLLALREANPLAKIYVQSLLPRESQSMPSVTAINAGLQTAILQSPLKDSDIIYLDLTKNFISDSGELRTDLSYDGLHLNENGYAVWASIIGRNVMRAQGR